MQSNKIVKEIFQAAIACVLPDKLIKQIVKLENNYLSIQQLTFNLAEINHLYVIGAGKASGLMAQQLESILQDRITAGHVIVKYGHLCELKYIKISQAGHPTPDQNSFDYTIELLNLFNNTTDKDLVICLISGGGSALLADLPPKCSSEELQKINHLLVTSGASIQEINMVRKHLSKVKGGWLAKHIYPAKTVSLILSDVIGDSLDVIASGPTTYDCSTYADAIAVLTKYQLIKQTPASILNHLNKGLNHLIDDNPKIDDPAIKLATNIIIGSNSIALANAQKRANELQINCQIISSTLDQQSHQAAKMIVKMAIAKQKLLKPTEKLCLLFGGETTVNVKNAKGLGGRNQHLALCAAKLLSGNEGITILSAGTDGNDGPTDAAGAIVNGQTWQKAKSIGLDGDYFLESFDSYNFFKQVGDHIITGATNTNVMDLIIVLICAIQSHR